MSAPSASLSQGELAQRLRQAGTAAARTPELALPVVVVILGIYFTIESDVFLTDSNFQNIGKQSAALAILAFGQTLVVISRGLDLSVGAVVGLTSIAGAQVWQDAGPGAGLFTFLAVGLAVGTANGILIAGFRLSPLITTLGMLSVCRALALILSGGLPVSPMPGGFRTLGTESVELWGWIAIPIPALIAILIFALCYVILRFTSFGVHIYSIGGNPRAARLAGINVRRGQFAVYAFNGLLAGLAGAILTSRVNSGQPLLGAGLELQVFATVFLGGVALTGGVGSLTGVFFGVLLIAVLGNGLNLTNVQSFYQDLIIGLVLILAIGLNRALRPRAADD